MAFEETDHELLERYPDVRIDHTNKHFYRGLLHREVRFSRCADCGRWHHRPKPICPRCWSKNLIATPISGNGVIYLVLHLHQGPPADGVDYQTPYSVASVELDEQVGLRFTTAVLDVPPDASAIGWRAQLDWTERGGRAFPVWRAQEPA